MRPYDPIELLQLKRVAEDNAPQFGTVQRASVIEDILRAKGGDNLREARVACGVAGVPELIRVDDAGAMALEQSARRALAGAMPPVSPIENTRRISVFIGSSCSLFNLLKERITV